MTGTQGGRRERRVRGSFKLVKASTVDRVLAPLSPPLQVTSSATSFHVKASALLEPVTLGSSGRTYAGVLAPPDQDGASNCGTDRESDDSARSALGTETGRPCARVAHRSKDWDVQEPLVSKKMVPGGNLSTAMDPEGRGSALAEVTGPLSSGGYPDMLVVNRVRANAVSIRVNICVEGRPTLAVVDSGAEVTIMNSQEFHQLGKPLTLSPPAVDLVVADQESQLRADGTVEMELVIGNHKFKWPVYVAQIGDDFFLGSNILDAQDIVVSSRRGLQVRGCGCLARWLGGPCTTVEPPLWCPMR